MAGAAGGVAADTPGGGPAVAAEAESVLFEVSAGAPGRRGKACRVRARVGAASLSVGVMLLALAGCDDMHDCSEAITHYRVLATIEAAYGVPRDGHAAAVAPITDIWRS